VRIALTPLNKIQGGFLLGAPGGGWDWEEQQNLIGGNEGEFA